MAHSPTPTRADEWRPIFLEALRNSGNVRAACKAAGLSRQAVYMHRRRSREFAAAWDEAMDDAVDMLEAIAIDRARKQGDTLLIFLLKAHRPAKYRETVRTQHTGPDDAPVRFTLDFGKSPTRPDDA
jgi:hypothetical protein